LFYVGATKTPRVGTVVSLLCSATMGVFDVVIVYCVATLECDAVRVNACVASFWLNRRAIRLADKMHQGTMNLIGGRTTIITSILCRVKPAMLDTPGSISKCRAMMQGNAR